MTRQSGCRSQKRIQREKPQYKNRSNLDAATTFKSQNKNRSSMDAGTTAMFLTKQRQTLQTATTLQTTIRLQATATSLSKQRQRLQTTTNVANNDKGCKQRQRLQTTTKVAKSPSKSLYIGLPGRIVATWNGSTSACRVQKSAK